MTYIYIYINRICKEACLTINKDPWKLVKCWWQIIKLSQKYYLLDVGHYHISKGRYLLFCKWHSLYLPKCPRISKNPKHTIEAPSYMSISGSS